MTPWPLLLAVAGAAAPPEVTQAVVRAFEHVGRTAPQLDLALERAAQRLAERAAMEGLAPAGEPSSVAEAVSSAGGHDPHPRAVLLRGASEQELWSRLQSRGDLAQAPATHVGAASARSPQGVAAVALLFTQRKVTLQPFARQVAPGAQNRLCGWLRAELASPTLFVTDPGGQVRKTDASLTGDHFCAWMGFPLPGRYTVEVMARGVRGPEVLALFAVQAGAAPAPPQAAPKPARAESELKQLQTDSEGARLALLRRINTLRQGHGAPPLTLDDALTRVATAYSERMVREGFFAHVAPDGQDVRARVTAAGYPFRRVTENLGSAHDIESAQEGIEHSPAHRANLLEAALDRIGLGLAWRDAGGRREVYLTQVLAQSAAPVRDARAQAFDTLARRRGKKMRALRRASALDRIAQAHAEKLVKLDAPDAPTPGWDPYARVFSASRTAKNAVIDVFVADHPTQVSESPNVDKPSWDQVGIGAIKADSKRHGQGRWWMVVIYAQTR